MKTDVVVGASIAAAGAISPTWSAAVPASICGGGVGLAPLDCKVSTNEPCPINCVLACRRFHAVTAHSSGDAEGSPGPGAGTPGRAVEEIWATWLGPPLPVAEVSKSFATKSNSGDSTVDGTAVAGLASWLVGLKAGSPERDCASTATGERVVLVFDETFGVVALRAEPDELDSSAAGVTADGALVGVVPDAAGTSAGRSTASPSLDPSDTWSPVRRSILFADALSSLEFPRAVEFSRAPDRLAGPSDPELVECSEGVVDDGPVAADFDAADFDDGESLDAEEFAVDDSSAQASPGALTIAPPTPRATAKAPTRPMCFE